MMWSALRKKVNKSSRSYQLSESDESVNGGSASSTTAVVLQRYERIPSSPSDGLSAAATNGQNAGPEGTDVGGGGTPRYENPYELLDPKAGPAPVPGRGGDPAVWVDNARHLLLRNDGRHDDTSDLRNNNHDDDDTSPPDRNTDGNANHFGARRATASVKPTGRVSPPRLKRREKTSSLVVRRHPTGADLRSATCQRRDVTGVAQRQLHANFIHQ